MEFLWAISKYLNDKLLSEAQSSPFFSLIIDEATDRTLEQHLIVYAVYLSNNGKRPHVTRFVELLALRDRRDGTAKSMYEVVTGLLEKMHWMPLKQVALATDGASSMTGHRTGLATRMRAKVPTLINVHCIAHREALAAGDAARSFPYFQMLDRFANKVYEWMGRSTNRRNELKRLLKDVFEEDYVVVL